MSIKNSPNYRIISLGMFIFIHLQDNGTSESIQNQLKKGIRNIWCIVWHLPDYDTGYISIYRRLLPIWESILAEYRIGKAFFKIMQKLTLQCYTLAVMVATEKSDLKLNY